MEVVRTDAFDRHLARVPLDIQRLCLEQLEIIAANPRDPRLHTKLVKNLPGVVSFRVTRRYRGFFYINQRAQIIVFSIKNRKDAYR